jgi:hypothetical protein
MNGMYVGEILVEIAEDWHGSFIARTHNDHVLGMRKLGFEVSATVHLDDGDLEEPPYEAIFRELLDAVRLALARCCLFGTMEVFNDGWVDDEEWKIAEKVLEELPDSYFEITPALTKEALLIEAERDEALGKWLDAMGELLHSQQNYEGENISLGEAHHRRKEGAEQMRKIVEGEDA